MSEDGENSRDEREQDTERSPLRFGDQEHLTARLTMESFAL